MSDFPTFVSATFTSMTVIPHQTQDAGVVRTQTPAKYVLTRRLTTRIVKAYSLTLSYMNQDDYNAWIDFLDQYGTFLPFTMVLPRETNEITVLLREYPSTVYRAPYWSCKFVVDEV